MPELLLYGVVGDDFWGEGFTASSVVQSLAVVGAQDILVRINSGGGSATDGIAIYNALKAHKGRVSVQIDAIAASAASLIAMAGDDIIMAAGALMMIHDPAILTMGTAADHAKSMEILDAIGGSFASVYAEKSGLSESAARDLMRVETWMTAESACEKKFATALAKTPAKEPAAFDYRVYAHAPQYLTARPRNRAPQANSSPIPKPEGNFMPQSTPQPSAETLAAAKADGDREGRAAERDRIAAMLDCEAAKGREALARHLAFHTDMTAEQAAAALTVAALKQDSSDLGRVMAQHKAASLGVDALSAPKAQPKTPNYDSIYAQRAAACARVF